MIAVVDYGVGNLRSVQRALERAGAEVLVTGDPLRVKMADAVILPGVGAFGEGMAQLEARGLVDALYQVIAVGKPLLGICLGMQLLFEESEEMGVHAGLGVLRGRVRRFPHDEMGAWGNRELAGHGGQIRNPKSEIRNLQVPHVGWNQLHIRQEGDLLIGVPNDSFGYFVHSYYVDAADPAIVLATTDYGLNFASVVGKGNVYGIQFHPEKSQEIGALILENFALLAE